MKIEHISGALLINLMQSDETSTLEDIIDKSTLSNASITFGYNMAHKMERASIAKSLYELKPELFDFNFMDDETKNYFVENDILKLKPLISDLEGREFDELVHFLFPHSPVKSLKKRLGNSVKKNGTIILNNLYLLKKIIPLDDKIDILLNLDHSLSLSIDLESCFNFNTTWLTENYSIYKIFKFLVEVDKHKFYHDCFQIPDTLIEHGISVQKIKRLIGNNLLNIPKMHDNLSKNLKVIKHKAKPIELNQDILFLDGMKVLEYHISVPKTSLDLFLTGEKLEHCVASYTNAVIAKKSQIINLKLDDELKYTIEIANIKKKPKIVQFKGMYNSDEMEHEDGKEIREMIILLINDKLNP